MRLGLILLCMGALCGCPDPAGTRPATYGIELSLADCVGECPIGREDAPVLPACLVLEDRAGIQTTSLRLEPTQRLVETSLSLRGEQSPSGQLVIYQASKMGDPCVGVTEETDCSALENCLYSLTVRGARIADTATVYFAEEGERCTRTWARPPIERCNGADDDCDGRLDEGFEGLGDACVRGVGACRAEGVVECVSETETGCGAVPSAPAALDDECSLVDADCDGQFAEDAVRACNTGYPEPCYPGVQRCILGDTPRWSACFGEFGEVVYAPEDEVCDDFDNDCDGAIDEMVDLATDPAHCGACDTACGAGDASARFRCADGRCVIDECTAGFRDLDGRVDNGCECVDGAADLVEPWARDLDCDGQIDEDREGNLVYVASDGREGGDGTAGAPFGHLRPALLRAEAMGWSVALEVGEHDVTLGLADGEAPVQIPDGVSLYGGFERRQDQWIRNLGFVRDGSTVLTGGSVVLTVGPLTRAVYLSGLSVSATAGQMGQWEDGRVSGGSHSIALRARGVGEHLHLYDVVLTTATGGMGAPGEPGRMGAAGAQGGRPGAELACQFPQCSGAPGIGGAPCEPLVDHPSGGRGGERGELGQSGEPFRGIEGGLGGASQSPREGRVGQVGSPAPLSAAIAGNGNADPDGGWRPDVGPLSRHGEPGTGGGGGGGGRFYGGSGGGSGGCPGVSSGPPSGGYGSFPLFVEDGQVRLYAVRLRPGQGGRGGAGGAAFPGGEGGAGGERARREAAQCNSNCANAEDGPTCVADCLAGTGGAGGQGGCGAASPGGQGGPSFAIFTAYPEGGRRALRRYLFLDDTGGALADQRAALDASTENGDPGVGGPGGRGVGVCEGRTADDGLEGVGGRYGCCIFGPGGRCDTLTRCI